MESEEEEDEGLEVIILFNVICLALLKEDVSSISVDARGIAGWDNVDALVRAHKWFIFDKPTKQINMMNLVTTTRDLCPLSHTQRNHVAALLDPSNRVMLV